MKSYLVFAAVCGLAMPAVAGGPVEVVMEPAPMVAAPAPDFDWTGFYVGLGLTRGNVTGGADDFDTSGYSAQVGYLRDLGTFVVGGELQYSDADIDDVDANIASSRLKLIGGYDAGRFLPYAFVGLSDIELSGLGTSVSDSTTNYGIGARFALGATGKFIAGLEYLVEDTDSFADTTTDLDRSEVGLRIDYKF
ncbi:MAG: porin family protein [Acetobacteraceae bacterium]|nr:MAG: porin family protein [Acetobacteraceae bacterium]